jgi:hypothetical protein
MPRFLTRPALALLGTLALLCLAACAPTATARVSPSATAPTRATATPMPTPTLVPAPTPTNVPAGWAVLDTPHFSLAYPASWSVQLPDTNIEGTIYVLEPPSPHDQGVEVTVYPGPPSTGSAGMAPYCFGPGQEGRPRVTLAGIPMAYQFGVGEGADVREWDFVNTQGTHFMLNALDAKGTTAVRAQDDSILATFRPDNAIPWTC